MKKIRKGTWIGLSTMPLSWVFMVVMAFVLPALQSGASSGESGRRWGQQYDVSRHDWMFGITMAFALAIIFLLGWALIEQGHERRRQLEAGTER